MWWKITSPLPDVKFTLFFGCLRSNKKPCAIIPHGLWWLRFPRSTHDGWMAPTTRWWSSAVYTHRCSDGKSFMCKTGIFSGDWLVGVVMRLHEHGAMVSEIFSFTTYIVLANGLSYGFTMVCILCLKPQASFWKFGAGRYWRKPILLQWSPGLGHTTFNTHRSSKMHVWAVWEMYFEQSSVTFCFPGDVFLFTHAAHATSTSAKYVKHYGHCLTF